MIGYIATFYSHFGAIRFKKACEKKGLTAVIMPVPRNLSSSCGSCVRFQAEQETDFPEKNEEMEQIVRISENGYLQIYKAEDA